MLLRAFGPVDQPLGERIEPARALKLAQKLDVTTRITARQGSSRLVGEVGKDLARELVVALLASVARERGLTRTIERIAVLAAEDDLPVVFLKFAALRLRGDLVEGSRGATDVDVLVPEARVREFQAVLEAAGFEDLGFRASEHQMPLLKSPHAGGVELHCCVPALRDATSGALLTSEHLFDSGEVLPVSALSADRDSAAWRTSFVPTLAWLTAHAIVHAFVQHGSAPHVYPLCRMVGDLIDLGQPTTDAAERNAVERGSGGAMSRVELEAVLSLTGTLARGDSLARVPPDSPAGLLLRHLVASTLDAQYREALRLTSMFRRSDAPSTSQKPLLLRFAYALAPTRAQLGAIYGPPRGQAHLLALRLFRPVDLVYRLGKYGLSYAAVKLRGDR